MSTRYLTGCDQCVWSGSYKSAAMADWAFRRHSCERWHAISAAVAANRAREKLIDRTPRPCLHRYADHQHGEYRTYVLDRCRCIPCEAAAAKYRDELVRRNAYGRSNLVDAQPARDHVRALTAAGLGLKRIAMHDGVPHGTLWKLMYGKTRADGSRTPSERITVATDRAIRAIALPTVADLGRTVAVDSTGTRRRIQALIALGWSVRRLAETYNLDRQPLDAALRGQDVMAKTAVAVKAMFVQIGDTPPPERDHHERQAAVRSRNRAAANGWSVPAEWDDDEIDDPDCTLITDETHGRPGADLDEFLFLLNAGEAPDRAARSCGVKIGSISTRARRDGRDDVLVAIARAKAMAAA